MSQELMITRVRKDRKMSQKELANRLNINRSLMSQIETGKVLPTFDTLLKIARILNCLVTDLYHEAVLARLNLLKKGGDSGR